MRACALSADGQPFCWGDTQNFAVAVPSFSFNIVPTATLLGGGRVAQMTALINCAEGEHVQVQIALQQGEVTGEGSAAGMCLEGGLQQFDVTVAARGGGVWVAGPAQATAVATIRERGGRIVNTPEWTRTVQLIVP